MVVVLIAIRGSHLENLESLKDIFGRGGQGNDIEGLFVIIWPSGPYPGALTPLSPLEAQGRPLSASDCAYLVIIRIFRNPFFVTPGRGLERIQEHAP